MLEVLQQKIVPQVGAVGQHGSHRPMVSLAALVGVEDRQWTVRQTAPAVVVAAEVVRRRREHKSQHPAAAEELEIVAEEGRFLEEASADVGGICGEAKVCWTLREAVNAHQGLRSSIYAQVVVPERALFWTWMCRHLYFGD